MYGQGILGGILKSTFENQRVTLKIHKSILPRHWKMKALFKSV